MAKTMRLPGPGPRLSAGGNSVDAADRARAIRLLEDRKVPLLHIDIMDDAFMGRTVGSPALVAAFETSLLKDVHLLVQRPAELIDPCVAAGAGAITVHVEADDPMGALATIDRHNEDRGDGNRILKGVGVFPETPLSALDPYLGRVDLIVTLGVGLDLKPWDPFADAIGRVAAVAAKDADAIVMFDGGVKADNLEAVAASRCDAVVSGSAIFRSSDIEQALDRTLEVLAAASPSPR
jgi:ribulose-phosphate 3-epimerase